MAERILAKAKAEQLWLEAIEKARKSDKTYELASILHYLEDRAMGRTAQTVQHVGAPKSPEEGEGHRPIELGIEEVNLRLTELLARAQARAEIHATAKKDRQEQRR
jgi:hypothetical protein